VLIINSDGITMANLLKHKDFPERSFCTPTFVPPLQMEDFAHLLSPSKDTHEEQLRASRRCFATLPNSQKIFVKVQFND